MDIHAHIDSRAIEAFCRKWHVIELSLFGSVLRADFGPDSDIDVLVTFAEEARHTLLDRVEMIDELQAIFGRRVDLAVAANLTNPFRRREILRTKEPLYAA